MPNRTIYIRVDDVAIFEQVYSAEWLHQKLQEEKENQGGTK